MLPANFDANIEQAARVIRDAEALLVTAGAGMGVDSGLPDFRGTEGFWRAYPAIAKLGLRFEEMANPSWFERSPELAWAFYGHRLALYRKTKPHAGFQRLLDCGKQKRHGYFVFTSNVDGQFQKAGFAPERIAEVHGSLHHFQCCQPCHEHIWDAVQESILIDESKFLALAPLPKCPHCRGIARPNVLMFGDYSWIGNRSEAQDIRLRDWLLSLTSGKRTIKRKLAIIEMGAGTTISSVRNLSERVADECDATLIRINPREPDVPEGQIKLSFGAKEGLRRIFELIET
ncbi:MAG: Sir2 family NAD-dependent protein deacetylase [Verrucomicrobiota bacterium]